MADFTQKQYLDFPGLKVYDGKIKELINAEVAARQEADNKHTADIATNATNIQNLTALVGGPIPEDATSTNVIDYIQEKTTGIATDTALEELTERVKNVENNKVDKEDGKGLSTNDYTTEEKNKLGGIAAGAQVNVIEAVKVNGVVLNVTDKAVDVTVPTGALASKDKVAEDDLETALVTKLNGKADKATTLTGYGITDAYTKTEADAKFADINIDTGVHAVTLETGTNDKTLKLTVDGIATDNIEVKNIYSKSEIDNLVQSAKDYADANDANETFTISYADKTITLTGSNGTNSTIDASEFVKDGMLSNVAYEEATNELVFTWNTDAGIAETKVKLTDIIDAINGSEGEEIKITVTDGNVINATLTQTVKDSLTLADTAVQPAALNNYYTKTEADTEFLNATEVEAKISQAFDVLDYTVSGTVSEKPGFGPTVTVTQTNGRIASVEVTGNYDNAYDAKGDAEAAYAAIESIPTTGENSIESLFA